MRIDRDTVRRKGSLVELLSLREPRNRRGDRHADDRQGSRFSRRDARRRDLRGRRAGTCRFPCRERTFQLLTQVAGRAGRGERSGQAIIQSLLPEHYSIDWRARRTIALLRQGNRIPSAMRYPPQVAMVNVVVRGSSFDEAMDGAHELADAARGVERICDSRARRRRR